MLIALGAWPAASAAAVRCVPAHWQAAQTPGLDFTEIPLTKTPKSSGCRDYRVQTCQFRDPVLGYVYSLGSIEPKDTTRPLWSKHAYRADGAKRLPFGVSWGDDPAAVTRKVRASGEVPGRDGSEIYVFTCWWSGGDGAQTSFHFGRDGKLAEVRQFVQP
ncbi:MAG: hypothetical protein ACREEO_02225 [Phenylobacterium sp.]